MICYLKCFGGGDNLLKRKYVTIWFLAFCLTATLFLGITSSGNNPSTKSIQPYDPWYDLNDDGEIDIVDVVIVALRFGTTGEPINKTALLLELQSRVDFLNEALETRIPKKGYISIPASAFVPESSYVNMRNNGWSLHNDENVTELFFGSVQLPNGANVTNVTFYWLDQGDENMVCRLWRYNQTHNQEMAEMWSSGNPGYGSGSNDAVAFATVDDRQYAYYLEVGIPGESNGHGAYHFQYAVIEYEYPI